MKLSKLATILRSKNAGPFRTTLDMLFNSDEAYQRVKNSGVLTKEYVSKLYNVKAEAVMGPFFVDVARGIKITIPKPNNMASGDPLSTDLYGAQQHIPLLDIEIP